MRKPKSFVTTVRSFHIVSPNTREPRGSMIVQPCFEAMLSLAVSCTQFPLRGFHIVSPNTQEPRGSMNVQPCFETMLSLAVSCTQFPLPCYESVLVFCAAHINPFCCPRFNRTRGVASTPHTPPSLHRRIQITNVNGGVVATPY